MQYGRKKRYGSSSSRGAGRKYTPFKKGSAFSRSRQKYARALPYNDDPQTPFCKWPLSSNRNEFYCKVTGKVTVAVGATNPYATTFLINFPGYYVSNGNSLGLTPLIGNNYDNIIALFDEYCVMSFSLSYKSEGNVATQGDGSRTFTSTWYSCRDLVDPTNITSEDAALNGAGMLKHSQFYSVNRYVKPQKPVWMPTIVVPAVGTVNFNQVSQSFPPGIQESIKTYFPQVNNGNAAGYLYGTWYVRWRGLSPETA